MNAKDISKKGVETLSLDLSQDDLSRAVKDAEVIYHLAAQPGISATTSFDNYLKNNIVATHNLLESIKDSPTLKGFINIATSSIYGAHATDSEEAPPKPTSYYGVTKLAADSKKEKPMNLKLHGFVLKLGVIPLLWEAPARCSVRQRPTSAPYGL